LRQLSRQCRRGIEDDQFQQGMSIPGFIRSSGSGVRCAEAPGDGPIQATLSHAAREHGVWLIGGALPAATEDPDRAELELRLRIRWHAGGAPRQDRSICSATTNSASRLADRTSAADSPLTFFSAWPAAACDPFHAFAPLP